MVDLDRDDWIFGGFLVLLFIVLMGFTYAPNTRMTVDINAFGGITKIKEMR